MRAALPPEVQQRIQLFRKEIFEKLAEQQAAGYGELAAMWREAHNVLLETSAGTLRQCLEKVAGPGEVAAGSLDKIEADSVVVEVMDSQTGMLFRRELPLKYSETDNGLILSGEDIKGRPAEIAFFSETAMSRLGELFGKGPDRARCNEHNAEKFD